MPAFFIHVGQYGLYSRDQVIKTVFNNIFRVNVKTIVQRLKYALLLDNSKLIMCNLLARATVKPIIFSPNSFYYIPCQQAKDQEAE